MITFGRWLVVLATLGVQSAGALGAPRHPSDAHAELAGPRVRGNPLHRLTDRELHDLAAARDGLRSVKLRSENIRYAEGLIHMLLATRIAQRNAIVMGPPGGGKTLATDLLAGHELEDVFKLQMHEMTPVSAVIGGEVLSEAEAGRFKVNWKEGLGGSAVGHIDEVQNSNPAVLAALNGLLNEHEIRLGRQSAPANTRNVITTSNATLYGLIHAFTANGQGISGPAWINRFAARAHVHNWMPPEDHLDLFEEQRAREVLRAMEELGDDVSAYGANAAPIKIDFARLTRLLEGRRLIVPSKALQRAYNELIHGSPTRLGLRQIYNERATRVAEEHRADPERTPERYYPSAVFSDRSHLQSPPLSRASALIDLLQSDLVARDEDLEKIFGAQSVVLGPDSLWRHHLDATTVNSGETRLERDSKGHLDVSFGRKLTGKDASDPQGAAWIEGLNWERAEFARLVKEIVPEVQQAIKAGAVDGVQAPRPDDSIEMHLLGKR